MNEKIVFFGTSTFSATILESLINTNYNVVAIVSQPDKPVGRKKILTTTPVKNISLKYNIPIFQPISLRKDYEFLKNIDIDLIITAAYGQILPQAILDMAKINCINVHGSLLPKYRGGAPIQRAIMNGDKTTGITIMQMVDKMDAGRMYAKKEIIIDDNMNASLLFEKMAIVGKDLLLNVLPDIINNNIVGEAQDENEVTYAYNITSEEEKIDFNQPVVKIFNLIRGLSLNPGAYCIFKNNNLKIYSSAIYQNKTNDNEKTGTIKIVDKNRLLVRCLDGYLEILELQVAGKSKMLAKDFLNGQDKVALSKERMS